MSEERGEEWEEYDNAVQWMVISAIVTLVLTIFLAVFSLPIGYLIGAGISKTSMDVAYRFLQAVFIEPLPIVGYRKQ